MNGVVQFIKSLVFVAFMLGAAGTLLEATGWRGAGSSRRGGQEAIVGGCPARSGECHDAASSVQERRDCWGGGRQVRDARGRVVATPARLVRCDGHRTIDGDIKIARGWNADIGVDVRKRNA